MYSQTYFLTCVCLNRRRAFQVHTNAGIALQTVLRYHDQNKYQLHAAVIMPDHIHALFTPIERTVEACASLIKGGISFQLRQAIRDTLWQDSYQDSRIRDDQHFLSVKQYILGNPDKAGLRDWPFLYPGG